MTTPVRRGLRLYRHTDFVRVYIIVLYFLVVAILAVYAFSPSGGGMSYILARLLPHLFYIPLVLTALWYPKQRTAHIIIFVIIFITLILAFVLSGLSIDAIFMVFTSFIYLWVFIAILAIPPRHLKAENGEEAGAAVKIPVVDHTGITGDSVAEIPSTQIIPLIESFRLGETLINKNTSSALRAIGQPAVPYIKNGLRSDSIAVRENCARLLGEMHDKESVDVLVELMADPSRRVHNSATQALAKLGNSALPRVKQALKDERWKVRAGAVVALRIIGLHDAMPLLMEMLDDESHYVRKEVVKSLARIGEEEIVAPLSSMLNDESRGVRLVAVGGLGRSGSTGAIAPLKGVLLNEKDAEIRVRAVHSLELIGTAGAFEAMKTGLNDADPEVSASVEEILKRNYRL